MRSCFDNHLIYIRGFCSLPRSAFFECPRRFLSWFVLCVRSVVALLLVVLSASVYAQEPAPGADDDYCTDSDPGCVPLGEWMVTLGAGIGLRTNPIINSEDIPLFLVPEVRYYGERFFFDTDTAGLTLMYRQSHMLNAVATIGFDQIYFKTRSIGNYFFETGAFGSSGNNAFADTASENEGTAPQQTVDLDDLHSRETAGLAGLEYAYYNQYWDLRVQLLQDVTGIHEGQEIRAGLAHLFSLAGEHFEAAAGFSWQSEKLIQYYYGINPGELEPRYDYLIYKANDGVSPFFRLDWRRPISNRWSWQATFHYRWLSREISNSPLVDETSVVTFHLGGVYHF